MNRNESSEVIDLVELQSLRKRRYLCVTSGFEIFCLDLKQRNDQTFSNSQDVPFIPRIATLDLLEEKHLAFVGLFKWRSNAFMIGGESQEKLKSQGKYVCTPFRHYVCTHTIKGTSCLAYGLSLANNATLSHSESYNVWKLKKPKLWPIVEEINGQIHVIDSAPVQFNDLCRDWLFSHEVFNSDTGTWAEEIIPKLSEDVCCIESYLVLGDRIYATASGSRTFLMFDSNKKEWEACSKPTDRRWVKDESSVKEVWHILERGRSRCVGRFPYEGELSDPLYVVIAIEKDYRNYSNGTHTAAYLVTSRGQILCRQRLIDIFKGPVWPCYMFDATIIEIDEEDGKTMCSIVKADPWDDIDEGNYMFINIFGVEMVRDAAPMVRELVAKGSKVWPGAIEQEFVRVHTKDSYVYKTDAKFGKRPHADNWAGVRACFL